MIEKKVELKPYKVFATCECGGNFDFAGTSYPTYPMKHLHRCNKCGKEKIFSVKYPYIDYEEIENNEAIRNAK